METSSVIKETDCETRKYIELYSVAFLCGQSVAI